MVVPRTDPGEVRTDDIVRFKRRAGCEIRKERVQKALVADESYVHGAEWVWPSENERERYGGTDKRDGRRESAGGGGGGVHVRPTTLANETVRILRSACDRDLEPSNGTEK